MQTKHRIDGKTVREGYTRNYNMDNPTDFCRDYVDDDLNADPYRYSCYGRIATFFDKEMMCTDIDEKFNLYNDIMKGKKISFHEKHMSDDFVKTLKEKKTKYTKKFNRKTNTTTHIYYVPVTHIARMKKSKFDTKYDIPKEPSYIMYSISLTGGDFSHDDTTGKISPEWGFSKDTRPKSSKKSMVNIGIREDMREHYDCYFDSIYDDFTDDLDLDAIEAD